MFQYEYEKRPPSCQSFASRSTDTTDWSRTYPSSTRTLPNAERAKRPLPPRPIICERIPAKNTVPLRVWILASASCLGICAVLVLATLVITKWGTEQTYTKEVFSGQSHMYDYSHIEKQIAEEISKVKANVNTASKQIITTPRPKSIDINEIDELTDIPTSEDTDTDSAILEKLSIFKNIVANRQKTKDLLNKPQIHPLHENIKHEEKKIEKKDGVKLPQTINTDDLTAMPISVANEKNLNEFKDSESRKLNFQPFKPLELNEINLPEFNKDYEEYYNDDNLYDDYLQSNTMTSYLIEKVQELHDWITSDADFEKAKNSTITNKNNDFKQLLKALNDSIVEGNATIVMNKLRDIYFGENYTNNYGSKRIILTNNTDMLSFGILTLDVMLLHNIQLMAWESQESIRNKMLKDPDVFAFNALFMDPTKVESKHNEITYGSNVLIKRQRQTEQEEFDLGKNLFENILEVGMSAARAAIHLGRAYKNTRNIINQISNKDSGSIQAQLRNIDGNTHALNHLQMSFHNDSYSVASNKSFYTELDCVWLLYCRNLVITSKLNAPFGTMARINGIALRMLAGELSADRAVNTMLYEALSGWTDLKCNELLPRCSNVNASAVVLDTILQPVKKSTNRGR